MSTITVAAASDWNPAAGPHGASLPGLFAAVCATYGERTAVSCEGESLTYSELQRRSHRIACSLAAHGARSGMVIAICLERSIDMIAAMLGVLQSGAAYLPLDPGYPAARLTETIADATPFAVITSRGFAERLRHTSAPMLRIDTLAEGAPVDGPPPVTIQGADPAYVIYTSGSTGQPKGVVVSHHNVARLLGATEPWFHFSQHDVWTMFHSCAFDFSVWEIWGALLTGGRLVIVPFATSRSPEDFYHLLVRERVTVLNQTPSAFVLLDQVDAGMPLSRLSLRLVIFGGEALQPAALRGWFARHGDRQPEVVNMYGITETTVHVTYRRLRVLDAEHERESVIGVPIPDLQLHLLDADLLPVPDGHEGEICIGGAGVSQGYLGRPELTSLRFLDDPFAPGGKLYRSGDLARRRADGELVYVGRRDCQVKINGFRIELGEVESALLSHPAIVQVATVAYTEPGSVARLAAYFVAQPHQEPSTRELSQYLAARLPAQMMPAFYQRLAVFPLTPNGKIDRAALPRPTAGTTLPDQRSLAAASSLEDLVAKVWCVVLKAKNVTLDDNFFDVGGSSLLLIAVRTGLQEQLDCQIPVTWMFECTTIRSLAARLAQLTGKAPGGMASPVPQPAPSLNDRVQRQRDAFARAKAARSVSL